MEAVMRVTLPGPTRIAAPLLNVPASTSARQINRLHFRNIFRRLTARRSIPELATPATRKLRLIRMLMVASEFHTGRRFPERRTTAALPLRALAFRLTGNTDRANYAALFFRPGLNR